MLEEVGGSVRLVSLCPATSIDPHANGGSLGPRRVFGGNLSNQQSVCCKPIESISYRESVREGGGLGGGRERHRGSKASLHRLHGIESSTAPESLLEVKRQATGGHYLRSGRGRW